MRAGPKYPSNQRINKITMSRSRICFRLLFFRHPMQSQRRHKEQEHDHDPGLQKEKQHDSSEFFLINLEQMNHPRCPGIPKRVGENEEKKNEDNADDKRAEEEVPKENDFLALHIEE